MNRPFDDESEMFNMGEGCLIHGDDYMRECSACGAEYCARCHASGTLCPDCALDGVEEPEGDDAEDLKGVADEADDDVDQLIAESKKLPPDLVAEPDDAAPPEEADQTSTPPKPARPAVRVKPGKTAPTKKTPAKKTAAKSKRPSTPKKTRGRRPTPPAAKKSAPAARRARQASALKRK